VPWNLLHVLDSMSHVMEGHGARYPVADFHRLLRAMAAIDPELATSQACTMP
jgi:hypothetical protein